MSKSLRENDEVVKHEVKREVKREIKREDTKDW